MQSYIQHRQIREHVRQRHGGKQTSSSKDRPLATKPDSSIVQWEDGDESFNPRNWSWWSKVGYTTCSGLTGLLTSGASASDSEIVPQAVHRYLSSHIDSAGTTDMYGTQIELLATSLYLAAFGLGTMVSGPFSETFGRNPVYIVSLSAFALFTLGSALSPKITSQLVCRFFMGLSGSPPYVTMGGVMADMWSPMERTWIFPALSAMIFSGPFLSPVCADLIATSTLSWHWIEWVTLIAAGIVLSLIIFLLPETYAPIVLDWSAAALRDVTGSRLCRGPQNQQTTLKTRIMASIQRPWLYLSQEPIVICLSLYLVLIYCILFGFLPGFSYIFGQAANDGYARGVYGWPQRTAGLSFLPMNVGFLLALAPLYSIYARFRRQVAQGAVRPEERLIYAMIGAPLLPVGILWMGFTAKPNISFWSPLVASGVVGFASITTFISCYQYVIEAYEERCSSALVGMTVTRYVATAFMVHAAVPMYENLGVQNSLLWVGMVAAVPMAFIPFILCRYGPWIGKESRYAAFMD